MQLLEVLSLQLGTSSYPLQFTLKIYLSKENFTHIWYKFLDENIYYVITINLSKENFTHIWYKFLDEKYIMLSQLCMKGSALCMCTKKFIINFGLLNNMLERWHTKGLSYLACNTSESFLFHALDGL